VIPPCPRHGTGRYTFSLPLMIGGLLAEQSEQTLNLLEMVGERMGIIFQLKDDELGLFGDQSEIGKPNLDERNVRYVRDLVVRLGIYEEARNLSESLADKARVLIPWLPGFKFAEREVLLKLLDYSLVRTG
jgi:geranylgeranyl pyrophosphate synthase